MGLSPSGLRRGRRRRGDVRDRGSDGRDVRGVGTQRNGGDHGQGVDATSPATLAVDLALVGGGLVVAHLKCSGKSRGRPSGSPPPSPGGSRPRPSPRKSPPRAATAATKSGCAGQPSGASNASLTGFPASAPGTTAPALPSGTGERERPARGSREGNGDGGRPRSRKAPDAGSKRSARDRSNSDPAAAGAVAPSAPCRRRGGRRSTCPRAEPHWPRCASASTVSGRSPRGDPKPGPLLSSEAACRSPSAHSAQRSPPWWR